MKIEVLETFMEDRDRFEAGDIRTVPDELGQKFCKHGWAKDMDAVVPTGDRMPGAAILDVQNTKIGVK